MSTPGTDTLALRVRSLTWQAEGVLAVELVSADGRPMPGFDAGSHIDLQLPTAPKPTVRSYSLCNAPGEPGRYVVAVGLDRNSRGGSRWVHQALRPGQVLSVGVPRNHFRLNEAAPRFALVAGGIGVTPMLAMARRLAVLGKPVQMLYAARNLASAAFADELALLVPELTLHLDDRAGGPPDLAAWLGALPRDTGVYCCGPSMMLDAFEQQCARLGLADAHIERFAAAPGATVAAGACTVELRKSGRSVDVPAGTSILDALLDAGIDWPYSCKEGVCGTCEVKVLDGGDEIDHRDGVLSAAERAAGHVMMPCVSGCKGARLVLEA